MSRNARIPATRGALVALIVTAAVAAPSLAPAGAGAAVMPSGTITTKALDFHDAMRALWAVSYTHLTLPTN